MGALGVFVLWLVAFVGVHLAVGHVARGGPTGAGPNAAAVNGAAHEVCDAVPAQDAGQQKGDADQRHERREVGAVGRVVALDHVKDDPGEKDGPCGDDVHAHGVEDQQTGNKRQQQDRGASSNRAGRLRRA